MNLTNRARDRRKKNNRRRERMNAKLRHTWSTGNIRVPRRPHESIDSAIVRYFEGH